MHGENRTHNHYGLIILTLLSVPIMSANAFKYKKTLPAGRV